MPARTEGVSDVVSAARLFGLARLLAVAICWSRFAGNATLAYLDGPAQLGIDGVFWVASVLAFLGIYTRPALLITGLSCFAYYDGVGIGGSAEMMRQHHVFAQALLTCLLALTPCDRAFCLRPGSGPISLWSQQLLRLQISVIYLGAVFEKSYPAWLDGRRMEQVVHAIYLGSDGVEWGSAYGVLIGVSVLVWAAELFLAIAVWSPRRMGWVLAVAFVLHAGIYWLTPVGTFSATMFVFLLAVVRPEDFGRVWGAEQDDAGVSRAWLPGPLAFGRVDLPLAPLALVPLLGLLGFGPAVRGFDGLALDACEVRMQVQGRPLPLNDRALSNGRVGIEAAAARACRRHGAVDVVGRCANEEGWVEVREAGWCPQGAAPRRGRRSAW